MPSACRVHSHVNASPRHTISDIRMTDLLIRGLDSNTVATLKRRAQRHHTSLQGEVKAILERTAQTSPDDPVEVARKIRENLAKKGIVLSDSADLIREDRDR